MTTRQHIQRAGAAALLLCGALHAEVCVPDFDPPPPEATLERSKAGADNVEFALPSGVPEAPWFRDEFGRHVIPNGCVVNTEDHLGDYEYPEASYRRMRSFGFNFQVVRLGLTRLGGWPGSAYSEAYVQKLDRLVRLGKEQGIKTVFKLTLYDFTGEVYRTLTEEHWAALFLNRDGAQDQYVAAWERLFRHYADEPAVWGYDLLNEPLVAAGGARTYIWDLRPEFKDNAQFQTKFFWPLYQRVIDRLHAASPSKWALVQSWHYTVADHRRTGLPSGPPAARVNGERVIFAPHYYGDKPGFAMQAYLAQAAYLKFPLLMGEYGPPTFVRTDTDLETQLAYELNFMRTVNLFDRLGVGMFKAWWSGSRGFEAKSSDRTWAMFLGPSHALGPERKYVVDVMCRTRPLCVAGLIHTYHFNFATREFTLSFTPGKAAAPSEIYLPLERHYPDGLRLECQGLVLALSAEGAGGFRVVANAGGFKTEGFRWDRESQRLLVDEWPGKAEKTTLRVLPGERE